MAVRKLLAAVFASVLLPWERLTLIRLSWRVAAVFFIRQSITEMLSLQQADSMYSIRDSRVYAAVHVVLG